MASWTSLSSAGRRGRPPPPMPTTRPPPLPRSDMEKIESAFRERARALSPSRNSASTKASLNSIFQKVNDEKKHQYARPPEVSPEAQINYRPISPTAVAANAKSTLSNNSSFSDPSEAVQVSSLLRRQSGINRQSAPLGPSQEKGSLTATGISGRAKSRPRPAAGRGPSSSHRAGASVSALTRLNANLYFAPTAAVRSPRLSELEVAHAVAVVTTSDKNAGVKFEGVQNHVCRVFDPTASPEGEAAELCRICTDVIANAAAAARPSNAAPGGGEVVVVHGSDLDAVALVCMAHLVVNEGVAPTTAEAQVRAKRPECSFKSNFKMPLIELEKLTKRSRGGNIATTTTKKQRLKSALKAAARLLLALGLLAVSAAVIARLYVTYRNRRLVSLSNEGHVPK